MAAYEGDLVKLRRYAEAGGDLEKRDSYRATPLLLAAEKVSVEAIMETATSAFDSAVSRHRTVTVEQGIVHCGVGSVQSKLFLDGIFLISDHASALLHGEE